MNPNLVPKVEAHLRALEGLGFSDLTKPLWVALAQRVSAHERREPTASDRAWPLTTPLSLEEHLGWGKRREVMAPGTLTTFESDTDARPPFGCALVEGRAYELTPSQRYVLADQFNMTPSRCVEVLQLVLFPAEYGVALVREVILRTQEHLDPKNRKLVNGPRKIVIDRWGDFMSACRAREVAREVEQEQARESGRYSARIDRLLKRAVETGITHHQNSGLAIVWLSECEAQGITTKLDDEQQEKIRQCDVREVLRTLLLSRGEYGLAKLVKEPFFLGEETKLEKEYVGFLSELDKLVAATTKK